MNLNWLSLVLWGTLIISSIEFGHWLFIERMTFFWLEISFFVFPFIFANIIIFNGLRQPNLFAGIDMNVEKKVKPLHEIRKKEYIGELNKTMEMEKPYLIPEITLNDLAEKTSISPRNLSYIINETYNQNFFDFINSYRIEESKKLLEASLKNRKTVLEILYEVGFNSKSSFNRAFSKHTGMSPTQYKKSSQHNKRKN